MEFCICPNCGFRFLEGLSKNTILEYLAQTGSSTWSDLWARVDISETAFLKHLRDLQDEGLIEKDRFRYWLTDKGEKFTVTMKRRMTETKETKKLHATIRSPLKTGYGTGAAMSPLQENIATPDRSREGGGTT